jgi:hypothetical protein
MHAATQQQKRVDGPMVQRMQKQSAPALAALEFWTVHHGRKQKKWGPLRESNPGPPVPETGIIPLDQADGMP